MSVEKLQQMGLAGFGKELPSQLNDKNRVQEKTEKVDKSQTEREKRIRVIPKGTVIYRDNQPDIAYTVTEPFYIIRSKKPKDIRGMERVLIESPTAQVYRDGDRVEWMKGTVIQVNKRKMITKK